MKKRKKRVCRHAAGKTVAGPLKRPELTRRGKAIRPQASAKVDNSMKKAGAGNIRLLPRTCTPYAVNSQFSLKIGDYTIKCSRISNLSIASEIGREVPEGGNSLYPNILPGASKRRDVLVIEEGFR